MLSLCSLLCSALSGFMMAQSAPAPAKPAHTSASAGRRARNTASTHSATRHSSPHATTSKKRSRGKKTAVKSGQRVIDPTRAREIQVALIREHYMQGEPSGTWDAETQAAMERYQADQGWQAKTTPDSRALIKLGLGPSHEHLLNPESAMTSSTPPAGDPNDGPKQAPAENALPQR
ncbi:MAG: peptidoglycan-binding domain-containing protein [Terriglobales bacterium]|jgi:hypothetical protein